MAVNLHAFCGVTQYSLRCERDVFRENTLRDRHANPKIISIALVFATTVRDF